MEPLRPIDEHAYREDPEPTFSWRRQWPTAAGVVVAVALLPLHLSWLGTVVAWLAIAVVAAGAWRLLRRVARR